MGSLVGIGEQEENSLEQQKEGTAVSQKFMTTFAQVLKEQNYKTLRPYLLAVPIFGNIGKLSRKCPEIWDL